MSTILLSLLLLVATAEPAKNVERSSPERQCDSAAVKLTYLGDDSVSWGARTKRMGRFSILNTSKCDLSFPATRIGDHPTVYSRSLRVERVGTGGDWTPWATVLEEVAPSDAMLEVKAGDATTFILDTLTLLDDADHDDAVPYRVVVRSTDGCWFASEPFYLKVSERQKEH